jgi:acetyl-CoA carboxylase biotin carboxyl carrier protein
MARREVLTPIPGVFYRRPDPDSEPFVTEGGAVEAGATIGLVEIMKNFQPVESEGAGTLVEFLVENEDAVVAGQPVAIVDDGA